MQDAIISDTDVLIQQRVPNPDVFVVNVANIYILKTFPSTQFKSF